MQFIDEYKPKTTADRFGDAFMGMGQAAGQGIVQMAQYNEQQKKLQNQRKFASQLTGVPEELLQNASPEQIDSFLKFKRDQEIQKDKLKSAEEIRREASRSSLEVAQLKAESAEKVANMRANAMAQLVQARAQMVADAQREKTRQKEVEREESKKTTLSALDRLNELVDTGSIGPYATYSLSGATREDAAEFDTLTGQIESQLVDMVSRGTLSNTRFKYITETLLPKSSDTPARAKGKLKALKTMLASDTTSSIAPEVMSISETSRSPDGTTQKRSLMEFVK